MVKLFTKRQLIKNIRIYLFFIISLVSLLPTMANSYTKLFPTAADSFWKKNIPVAMRNDYIQLGNRYIGKGWKAISNDLFAEFRTNGNRTNFETESFAKREQFTCLVMAEIMQQKGRFTSDICRGLHYFIEQEPWWGLPAHYPKDHPERDLQVVDLFNAETASMLAWTTYMLGAEIDKREKGLCDSVRSEIERRFLNPTLYNKQGWKDNANNWNTWITSNWLECVMLCENDSKKCDEAVNGIKADLRLFLKGYPDDGGCEEGVDYWDRAGASFFESVYFLDVMGKTLKLSEEQRDKVHNMGRFITNMHIKDLSFVNFSDAKSKCLPNINILFPFGLYFKDNTMMEFAAFIAKKHNYFSKPSYLFQRTGNYPPLGRELLLLSMIKELKSTKSSEPRAIDDFLANSQIMVASTMPSKNVKHSWFVAAKGGNNGESHNHNDVGNFIIYHNDSPIIIDLGRDTYTSQTFGNHRYELMNNRSAYHNVPIINGLEQSQGKRFKASEVVHHVSDSISTITMNLAKAYTKEAYIDYWQRTINLNRTKNNVEITENYKLDSLQIEKDRMEGEVFDIQIVLICYGKPIIKSPGTILLQDGNVALRYDSSVLAASTEKVVMANGIMKKQWNDNVYRILLRLNDNYPKKEITYSFEGVTIKKN